MHPDVAPSIVTDDGLAPRWTDHAFLAREERVEGKHDLDGPDIVPMNGGTIAHQCTDGITIFEMLSDARVTANRLANRCLEAMPSLRRPGVALEPTAIVAAAPARAPSGSWSADGRPSGTCMLAGLDPTVPLATAYRRLGFAA